MGSTPGAGLVIRVIVLDGGVLSPPCECPVVCPAIEQLCRKDAEVSASASGN